MVLTKANATPGFPSTDSGDTELLVDAQEQRTGLLPIHRKIHDFIYGKNNYDPGMPGNSKRLRNFSSTGINLYAPVAENVSFSAIQRSSPHTEFFQGKQVIDSESRFSIGSFSKHTTQE